MIDPVVCDLVLLSWNHLEETAPCLETLFRHTDVPCRLFIVDNGSEAPVREFLRKVTPHGQIREVTLLQNETNEGFPKGMNRGLRASTAPFVCLLNNDLLFTTAWLSPLLRVADGHPEIGILNPASSTFGDHPPNGMSLDAYAAGRQQTDRYVEVGMCIGFCFLMRREVIDRIGVLEEGLQRIFFEDEDYCMRAQQAGFRCVVAEGSYVYHHEHRTVNTVPEREAIFQANRQWLRQRWGRRLRVASPRFETPVPGSEDVRAWLSDLIGWARRRVHVYVYCSLPPGVSWEQLFRSVDLVPHADVQWRRIPVWPSRLAAAGAILKRQKKRFDAILAPDAEWAEFMRGLGWIHRSTVMSATDTEGLSQLWQTKRQSAS